MRILTRPGLLAMTVAVLATAGCGESWQSDVYPASGRVSINGQPPVGALVQLVPVGEKKVDARNSRPWGLVKDDGTFTLSTYDGAPGAPVGDYAFTITWPPDASRPSMVDRLKSKFAKPDSSRAPLSIRAGTNVLPPIELTGVDVDMKAGTTTTASMAPPMRLELPKKAGRR
ncbi:hypothetical protein ACYOEI_14630 [Singulisphaera rosea]